MTRLHDAREWRDDAAVALARALAELAVGSSVLDGLPYEVRSLLDDYRNAAGHLAFVLADERSS